MHSQRVRKDLDPQTTSINRREIRPSLLSDHQNVQGYAPVQASPAHANCTTERRTPGRGFVPRSPVVCTFPLLDKPWPWAITVEMIERWQAEFPAIDVAAACAAAHARYLRWRPSWRTYRDIRPWLVATLAKEGQFQTHRRPQLTDHEYFKIHGRSRRWVTDDVDTPAGTVRPESMQKNADQAPIRVCDAPAGADLCVSAVPADLDMPDGPVQSLEPRTTASYTVQAPPDDPPLVLAERPVRVPVPLWVQDWVRTQRARPLREEPHEGRDTVLGNRRTGTGDAGVGVALAR